MPVNYLYAAMGLHVRIEMGNGPSRTPNTDMCHRLTPVRRAGIRGVLRRLTTAAPLRPPHPDGLVSPLHPSRREPLEHTLLLVFYSDQ